MELDLEFNITRTRGDISSTSKLRIAKDRAGPIFVSRETESMFILTAHLKGFPRDNVSIKINEDGSRITISGNKPVQEIVTKGWIVYRNEGGMKSFAKVFRIPDGVVMNRIKAKFDEHDSILTISMPKLVKGIQGLNIEEVEELEDVGDRQESEAAQAVADDDTKKASDDQVVDAETSIPEKEEVDENVPQTTKVAADNVAPKIENYVSGETLLEETEQAENQEALETPHQNQDQIKDATTQNVESPIAEPQRVEPEVAPLPPTREITSEEVAERCTPQPTKALEDGVTQQPDIPNPTPVQQHDVEEKTQEPSSDVQEAPKQEGKQKESQAPAPVRPAHEHEEGETWGQEETHPTKSKVEETEKDQVKLPEDETTVEKTNDHGNDECHKNNPEWTKLSCPVVITGSAILVSLLVYFVHSIRKKKHK